MKTTDELKGKIDFAIITIREDEYAAVLKHFPSDELRAGPNRLYSITRLTLPGGSRYQIACAPSIEQGGGHAQDAARDIIEDLDPQLLLLVGIAGAVPDAEFTLGDVVIAKRLHDFSVGAAIEGRSLQASNQGGPMHKLVQNLLAQLPALKKLLGNWNLSKMIGMQRPELNPDEAAIYGDEEWIARVKSALDGHFGPNAIARPPTVTARSIASSNILVKDVKTLRDWQERARELAAIEMELNGVYIAARRFNREYPILAIRGISDIVGLRREAIWTQYACKTAASCAYAFVASELLPTRKSNDKRPDMELDTASFEKLCSELRDRRVGVNDEWGGEVKRGTVTGSQVALPVRFNGSGLLVVQFIPESVAISPPTAADFAKLETHPHLLESVQSWIDHLDKYKHYHYNSYPVKKRRRNIEGFLLYTVSDSDDWFSSQYIQLFSNGVVEAVDQRIMSQVLHSRVIPGAAVEQAIATLVEGILAIYRLLSFTGKVWIASTLLAGMENVTVSYDENTSPGPHKIGKRHRLLLPPVIIDLDEEDTKAMDKLKLQFDALAHAGGWDKSPNKN